MNTNPLIEGRKADSARRRQRVIKAINVARRAGTAISVSGIARQAGVDRAFLYRHKDLLAQVHAAGAEPCGDDVGPVVSRASLQADLGSFVWIIGWTRGRCPRCGVRPGRWWLSSRNGWRCLATASGG